MTRRRLARLARDEAAGLARDGAAGLTWGKPIGLARDEAARLAWGETSGLARGEAARLAETARWARGELTRCDGGKRRRDRAELTRTTGTGRRDLTRAGRCVTGWPPRCGWAEPDVVTAFLGGRDHQGLKGAVHVLGEHGTTDAGAGRAGRVGRTRMGRRHRYGLGCPGRDGGGEVGVGQGARHRCVRRDGPPGVREREVPGRLATRNPATPGRSGR